MKVKICGIRTYEDAMFAIEAGADILGFNFYSESPRYIVPGDCSRLIVRLETALHESLSRVMLFGVFVNDSPDFMLAILRDCHLDRFQLAGDEPSEVLEVLGERSVKVLRPVTAQEAVDTVERYPRRTMTPAWLVDTYRKGSYGGTGKTCDWGVARRLAEQAPILLAGGLRPENVAEAIRVVEPWGVDVASGVESVPGVKDPEKMKTFIQAAKAAVAEAAVAEASVVKTSVGETSL